MKTTIQPSNHPTIQPSNHHVRGFTLLELLVTIGILVLLIGATAVGYGKMAERAKRTKDQELVSNVATALTMILQDKKVWPKPIRNGMGGEYKITADVCDVFARQGLLGITKNAAGTGVDRDSASLYRFGLMDSAGQVYMKSKKGVPQNSGIPGVKGQLKDHLLRYAVDLDGDGKTELPDGKTKVMASACVWAVGADGMDGFVKGGSKNAWKDDVRSWSPKQEVAK